MPPYSESEGGISHKECKKLYKRIHDGKEWENKLNIKIKELTEMNDYERKCAKNLQVEYEKKIKQNTELELNESKQIK